MARLVLLTLLALCWVTLARAAPLAGAEGITVLGAAARGGFPDPLTFTLDAAGPAGIVDATLTILAPGGGPHASRWTRRPTFTPGEQIQARWAWDPAAVLPPGSLLTYTWRIRDGAGRVLETPEASVRVEDTRFTWRELREGEITVRWYDSEGTGGWFGPQLLDAARAQAARIGQEFGLGLRAPVTIQVYRTQQDLRAVMRDPAWGYAGVAFGGYGTVLAIASPYDMSRASPSLAHELTHILTYQYTVLERGRGVERWLDEGLAVMAEGWTADHRCARLGDAIVAGTLPHLRLLSASFAGRLQADWRLSYAAAESIARFLTAAGGTASIRALLAEASMGRSMDDALRRVYGRGLDEIDAEWRTSLALGQLEGSPRVAGGSGWACPDEMLRNAATRTFWGGVRPERYDAVFAPPCRPRTEPAAAGASGPGGGWVCTGPVPKVEITEMAIEPTASGTSRRDLLIVGTAVTLALALVAGVWYRRTRRGG